MSEKIFSFVCGLSYDGSQYHGWQQQANNVSIQACIERAISSVAGHAVLVDCAGRTDAGVHATAQIIRFQTSSVRRLDQWLMGVNAALPPVIKLQWVKPISADFHPRFQATERSYRYIIYNSSISPCFARHLLSWYFLPLNAEAMHRAAQYLIGEHDFSAFRGSDCQSKTPFREVKAISVKRHGSYILIDICANAFLHHMVRNIVGTLLQVGEGKRAEEWVKMVLESKNRREAGITALPNGLYLVGVRYPQEFDLPTQLVLPEVICYNPPQHNQ
jgi:tRNA pseudouridine38-40 synthase